MQRRDSRTAANNGRDRHESRRSRSHHGPSLPQRCHRSSNREPTRPRSNDRFDGPIREIEMKPPSSHGRRHSPPPPLPGRRPIHLGEGHYDPLPHRRRSASQGRSASRNDIRPRGDGRRPTTLQKSASFHDHVRHESRGRRSRGRSRPRGCSDARGDSRPRSASRPRRPSRHGEGFDQITRDGSFHHRRREPRNAALLLSPSARSDREEAIQDILDKIDRLSAPSRTAPKAVVTVSRRNSSVGVDEVNAILDRLSPKPAQHHERNRDEAVAPHQVVRRIADSKGEDRVDFILEAISNLRSQAASDSMAVPDSPIWEERPKPVRRSGFVKLKDKLSDSQSRIEADDSTAFSDAPASWKEDKSPTPKRERMHPSGDLKSSLRESKVNDQSRFDASSSSSLAGVRR